MRISFCAYVFSRESRAVDMESLCVVAGKHVWSVRVDLHILDNGGYGLLGYALSDDIINLSTLSSYSSKLVHCHAFPQESH